MGGGPSGPTLVALESILLPEADTLYIGDPFTPVIDPFDGSIYISDQFSKRVLRFDRQGEVIQTYGRPGGGPGELQGSGLTFVLDDSTLVVEDWAVERLNLFDRESGEYRSGHPFVGIAGLTPPVKIDGGIWFPTVDRAQRRALARWTPREDTVRTVGEMPLEFHTSLDGGRPGYANYMNFGSLTLASGALVRGWQPRNDLIRYTPDGAVLDTLVIPTVRRRGVPENLRYLYDVEGATGRERITINSRLRQLHTLPDGGLAFTHHDQIIRSLDGPMPVVAADVWVGVVSPDLQQACVDTPVPASSDVRAMETFRGDTLFVLDRQIVDDSRLETRINLYLIDTEGCDWIPLGR